MANYGANNLDNNTRCVYLLSAFLVNQLNKTLFKHSI